MAHRPPTIPIPATFGNWTPANQKDGLTYRRVFMDDRILDLLRDLASDFENSGLYWTPISEIRDLGDEAVPKLVDALRHGDPLIRKMAALAIGDLRSPIDNSLDLTSVIPHLEKALKTDADPEVRRQAAESLWDICEHPAALQDFLDGLHEENVEARRWGAIMLCLVGEKAPRAIRPLIAALDDPDVLVRRYVAEALAMHGAGAASALPKLELLLGEDEWTRVIGVEAILKIDSSRTEDLSRILAEALASRSRLIRHQVAQALGDLPNAGRIAVPELVETLTDEEWAVRMATLATLDNLGPAASLAAPTLIKILQGEGRDGGDILARGQAADVLASIGQEAQEVAYFLLECLDEPGDDDMTVHFRLKVARALWLISGDPDHVLPRAVELLGNPNWWLRYRAAVVLGDLGAAGRAAVPLLRRALEDEHPSVRRSAAGSLEKIAGS
jgi:HEAT repeat protein